MNRLVVLSEENMPRTSAFKTGTKDSCQNVLELANWIPSFDEWHPRLHLGSGAEAPYYSTHMPPTNNATRIKSTPFEKRQLHHISN